MSFVGPSPRPTNGPQAHTWLTSHHDTYTQISPSNFNLNGKSVLVAGASKGIGRTTALRYAMAGCSKIAIGARSDLSPLSQDIKTAANLAGHPEPLVLPLVLDVTSNESVQAAAAAVAEAFSDSLDILIANAGCSERWVPIGETDPLEWWRTFEVNVQGLYLVTRHFLPFVLKSDTKTLICVSSIGAVQVTPGAAAYQVAKLAASRFVEFVDQEYHSQGVIALSVHPGGVATELGKMMPEAYHQFLIDSPELAGDSMVWLGAQRREWLAGRYVHVNWDVEELEARKEEIVEKDLLKFRLVL
ncbi:hypothetical protein B0H66DRAFT_584782 [Apodospora peruviana]|uniref:Uncharacterized protein n=1 Tax=Apodospora peruviana TaxID=516989 RepID=A0AAE0LZ62_9PEZI|nr:hypothetical protein B0H66DRAFT_584782 [Apodospora peruviana]